MEPDQAPELDRLPRWAPFVVMGVLTLLVFRRYLLSAAGVAAAVVRNLSTNNQHTP